MYNRRTRGARSSPLRSVRLVCLRYFARTSRLDPSHVGRLSKGLRLWGRRPLRSSPWLKYASRTPCAWRRLWCRGSVACRWGTSSTRMHSSAGSQRVHSFPIRSFVPAQRVKCSFRVGEVTNTDWSPPFRFNSNFLSNPRLQDFKARFPNCSQLILTFASTRP